MLFQYSTKIFRYFFKNPLDIRREIIYYFQLTRLTRYLTYEGLKLGRVERLIDFAAKQCYLTYEGLKLHRVAPDNQNIRKQCYLTYQGLKPV